MEGRNFFEKFVIRYGAVWATMLTASASMAISVAITATTVVAIGLPN